MVSISDRVTAPAEAMPGDGGPQSLPEIVCRELRSAILNGVFAPGEMLRQEVVAAQLGVSRSPIREALPRLAAEGIIVLHPRRGYAVVSLDPVEIMEAFDLRGLLETDLSKRSIANRKETDVAKVYSILAEMSAIPTKGDQAQLNQWFELNSQFHQALLKPANRPHHMRALEKTRGLIESYIRTEVRLTGDVRQAQEEHAELAHAFVRGDREEFVRLVTEHCLHTRNRLLAGLSDRSTAQ